jgi:hypothetical protein
MSENLEGNAVSHQNVELVRRLLAAFNDRDMSTIRGILDPDVDLRTLIESQHGHEGAADWIARADSVFDSFEMEVEEIIDGASVSSRSCASAPPGRAAASTSISGCSRSRAFARDGSPASRRSPSERRP